MPQKAEKCRAIMDVWGERLLYLDGGMGTMLEAMGLSGGEAPEMWNLLHPERVKEVHRRYLAAGCDMVTANTFGATRAHLGENAAECMAAGVTLAREAAHEAGHGWVAADLGPLGRLLAPYGDLPFEEAVTQFHEAAAAALLAGADALLIETMTDLLEVKAAVLGAKEAMEKTGVRIPLLCSLTFDESGRLLTGADIRGTAAMLEGLRVDAIGLNCGHEPEGLLDNAKELLRWCRVPVFISPNASLPVMVDGVATFPTTPEAFAVGMRRMAAMGAWGLGGCCGTTPAHIAALIQATKEMEPKGNAYIAGQCEEKGQGKGKARGEEQRRCEEKERGEAPEAPEVLEAPLISGRSVSVVIGQKPLLIGERLNPTGKPRMKQALREKDMDFLLREAIAQAEAGADALDVNVGLPEVDEPQMLREAVCAIQGVCDLPLQLDTADPIALEAALRVYAGKPLINSVCGKQGVMDVVFPLAAKYGGAIVALTLDEQGIPETVEGRMQIARRIVAEAQKYGIDKRELLFDALTMAVSTNENAANVTLETVERLTRELGVHTILGVSNVSFGLPQRPLLTAAFAAMAISHGLSAAILNPMDDTVRGLWDAAVAVTGQDAGFAGYLKRYGNTGQPTGGAEPRSQQAGAKPGSLDAAQAIARGLVADAASAVRILLEDGMEPTMVIEQVMMPALADVGERYEKGTLFLPQLLQSAAAAQAAFEIIRAKLPEKAADASRRVVIATVQGDVHDIGKNIVKVLLQNYGFAVTDLGRSVSPEAVLAAVQETGATVVGLSALMTTTLPAMKETISLLKGEAPHVRVMVGGAVLTAEYAAEIGADAYGKDAMAAVRLAQGWV